MGSFWTSKLRTRRKAHRCETCGQQVPAGALSYDEAGIFEGDITSYKQCRACHEIVRYFFWRGTFDYSEGYQFEWLAEEARAEQLIWPPVYGYVAAAPDAQPASTPPEVSS